VRDLAAHHHRNGVGEGRTAHFHGRLALFALVLDVFEAAREVKLRRAAAHGGERVCVAERSPASSRNSRRAVASGSSSGSIPPLTTSSDGRSIAYFHSRTRTRSPLSCMATTLTPGLISTYS
jgi:hypothetical protein